MSQDLRDFIVFYEARASIPVRVTVDVDGLGGKRFEEAIRRAAKVEFPKANTQLCHSCSGDMTLGEFSQDYGDDGIQVARPVL